MPETRAQTWANLQRDIDKYAAKLAEAITVIATKATAMKNMGGDDPVLDQIAMGLVSGESLTTMRALPVPPEPEPEPAPSGDGQ